MHSLPLDGMLASLGPGGLKTANGVNRSLTEKVPFCATAGDVPKKPQVPSLLSVAIAESTSFGGCAYRERVPFRNPPQFDSFGPPPKSTEAALHRQAGPCGLLLAGRVRKSLIYRG
jgi:hypothetical protein